MRSRPLTRLLRTVLTAALLLVAGAATAATPGHSTPDPISGVRQLTPAEQAELAAQQGPNGMTLGQSTEAPAPSSQRSTTGSSQPQSTWRPAGVQGMDVSNWQGSVNWSAAYRQGARFAFVKATEGTNCTSPTWQAQYTGAASHGLLRGSYHRALPSVSSAAAQARFLVAHGGGWRADGKTLPPVLDIEFNKYSVLGDTCYDMSQRQLQAWISEFVRTMDELIGRHPVIYTNTNWWQTCVGTDALGGYPLWVARYAQTTPALPSGWSRYHFWQYSDSGPFAGDSDVWHSSYTDLRAWARAENGPVPAGRAVGRLEPGQQITSPNGRYTLRMQTDGNLVTYNQVGRPIWAAGTALPGLRLAGQSDGNLVLYSGSRPLWWTGTHSTADRIRLQDDGNLVVGDTAGRARWDSFRFTRTGTYTAAVPVIRLEPGAQAVGLYGRRLVMQRDGNLVYSAANGKALWSSRTHGRGASRAVLQSDGNLVVYTLAGRATWQSGTRGRAPRLALQSDGNLVLYLGARAVWWVR